MSFTGISKIAARALVLSAALGAVCGAANAEQIVALPIQGRVVGPYISGQISPNPVPAGGWQASDDRHLNASINGQGGWQTLAFADRFDEEIATGISHSGGHSWRLSNWFHSGYVNAIVSPQFASVGETGSSNGDGGTLGGPAKSNHVVYEFWFRSASTQPDPGSYVSTTISDIPGNRLTYFGIFDERPGDSTSNCPDTSVGCFHIDVAEVVSGNDKLADGDATFVDHYSDPLQRGVWYRAHIDATFVDGAGVVVTDPQLCPAAALCHAGNDQIHYQVFDGNGNVVFDRQIGSWEAAYFDGRYGNAVGTRSSADYIGFRVSASADDGQQMPFQTNSATNRPHGVYFDDMRVTPDVGPGFSTSFDYDRYVEKSGTDAGDCTVQGSACKTIGYAVGESNPYDSVLVGKGTYAENGGAQQNLVLAKPIAIEGAQVGVDARTRDIGGSGDANETILVPSVMNANASLDDLGDVSVVQINSSGVSLDGLVVDGDNTGITSGVAYNGTDPDADTGILTLGPNSNLTVQNTVVRNLPGGGFFACTSSDCRSGSSEGDNLIQHNRFTNITNPSTWGVGIYVGNNFYAQIADNLFDTVRVGIQEDENDYLVNPGTQVPMVSRNEIHATRTGIFQNLFYANASTYTVDHNTIVAVPSAQVGEWNGMQIESMADSQTVVVTFNTIDALLLAGSGRPRAGYVVNNLTSTATAAIDGGSVSNVDVGVLSTDATNYTGPVNGVLVKNVAFNNIALAAMYIEDTTEIAGSPSLTVGTGNMYSGVTHELALSGANAFAHFSGISGVDSVFVRAAGTYLFGRADTYAACSSPSNPSAPLCRVTNASLNAGIAAAAPGGTVFVEHGTFDETGFVGTGKDGVRVTADDPANPPTLTRLSGGPAQPVFVVAATSGVAPKNVQIDHLNFVVDKSFSAEGLLASGFVDGISIHDNSLTQIWSDTTRKPTYNLTNAISINIDPDHNSIHLPGIAGSSVSIHDNTIAGSSSPHTTMFRGGISVDNSVGTINHNNSAGLNHDAIVRFSTTVAGGSNGVTISDNNFTGGGLEFDSPNAGITPIAITNNTITANPANAALAPDQAHLEADISVLRLIDNYQSLAVAVSHNTFAGYSKGYRGATVQNFPNATFTDNTFTPFAGTTDFVSLVVSNKSINQNAVASAPFPMSFTALRNMFNGSGAAGTGRAVEFINDNDANGTAAFDAIDFGDATAANANSFDANHQFYFNLVDQNCETATTCMFLDYVDVGTVANTHVRPFRGNVNAINNLFGGVAPHAMSPLQQAQLNAQTHDVLDDPLLGYVDYGFNGAVELRLQGPVSNMQVGVATPYSAQLTNTGASLAENVLVHFAVSRSAAPIQPGDLTIKYDAGGGNFQIIPLSSCAQGLCGTFGPPSGFALPSGYNALTQLQDTFAVDDTFAVQAIVQGVTSGVTYAADTLSTQVVRSAASVALNLAGPQTATAGATTTSYTARLTNTGGAIAENVMVDFSISRSGGISSDDLALSYFDGTSYQPIPLMVCGANLCGSFGPPTGFAISAGYDVTTALAASYVRSGSFSVTASVDGVTSHTSYTTSNLVIAVAPGTAAKIAANSSQNINGIAGSAALPLPSVVVTDANNNPVPGVSVTFTTAANSGTLSGAVQSTDANGVATVGGWTFGTAATQTVNAAGTSISLLGSPISFVAQVTAQFDLAVSMTAHRDYMQYGHTLDYVIVVSNAGPSTSTNAVTDVLPPELDANGASWVCLAHTSGATCVDSGRGDLSDAPSIPAGGSVTYVLSANVINDPDSTSEVVMNQINVATAGDSDTSNNSTAETTQIVIFRDGFDPGGDGAQSNFVSAGTLSDSGSLNLDAAAAPSVKNVPATWVRAVDASQREIFRIDSLRTDTGVDVRVVTTNSSGNEVRSAWAPLSSRAAAMALAIVGNADSKNAVLETASGSLQIALPSWTKLPVTIYTAQ